MPTIDRRISFASGGGEIQVPLGQYEYLPWDANLQVAAVQSGSGAQTAVVNIDVFSGSDLLQERGRVNLKQQWDATAANRGPDFTIQNPFDFLVQDVAAAGERIGVTLTSNSASEVRVVVILTPIVG